MKALVVLILVLMEDALRGDIVEYILSYDWTGLNPCSNGRCSARANSKTC